MAIREFDGAEDEAWYMQWIERNPDGYVLNTARPNPKPDYIVLHRTTCRSISRLTKNQQRFTGGSYMKVGSNDRREIERWARERTGGRVTECPLCKP
jgi:hypothetical protein